MVMGKAERREALHRYKSKKLVNVVRIGENEKGGLNE